MAEPSPPPLNPRADEQGPVLPKGGGIARAIRTHRHLQSLVKDHKLSNFASHPQDRWQRGKT